MNRHRHGSVSTAHTRLPEVRAPPSKVKRLAPPSVSVLVFVPVLRFTAVTSAVAFKAAFKVAAVPVTIIVPVPRLPATTALPSV